MHGKHEKKFLLEIFIFWGKVFTPPLKLFGGVIPTSSPPLGRLCLEDQDLQNDTWNLKVTCMPIFLMRMYYYRFGGMFYGIQESLPQNKIKWRG